MGTAFYYKISCNLHQGLSHLKRFRNQLVEKLCCCFLFQGQKFHRFFLEHYQEVGLLKQDYIDQGKGKKTVFFVFRGLHFVDWFIPIHQALEQTYPGQYQVFYVDFASTIKRIGTGVEYISFRQQVAKRLLNSGLSSIPHFAFDDIEQFENFPQPDMILTSEGIRHERFETRHRVFLPHGCVTKAGNFPGNIRCNHFFQPAKAPYTYPDLEGGYEGVTIHAVGYPKFHSQITEKKKIFDNDKPVILYAPSLEKELLLSNLKEGIIDQFKALTQYNFVLKLHPSLGSNRSYIGRLFEAASKGVDNIRLDHLSNIQELAGSTSLLITDFGSVGPEYKLKFGKPVIFLQIPSVYAGGGDTKFRDHFGDEIIKVPQIKTMLPAILARPLLTAGEHQQLKEKVLYAQDRADQAAAIKIHEILSESSINQNLTNPS